MSSRCHSDAPHFFIVLVLIATVSINPSDLFRPFFHTLCQTACGAGIRRKPGSVRGHDIFKPEFQRIHTQPLSHYIDRGLYRKVSLWIAEASHGPCRGCIGIDAETVVTDIGNLVNAYIGHAQNRRHVWTCTGIGSCV